MLAGAAAQKRRVRTHVLPKSAQRSRAHTHAHTRVAQTHCRAAASSWFFARLQFPLTPCPTLTRRISSRQHGSFKSRLRCLCLCQDDSGRPIRSMADVRTRAPTQNATSTAARRPRVDCDSLRKRGLAVCTGELLGLMASTARVPRRRSGEDADPGAVEGIGEANFDFKRRWRFDINSQLFAELGS